MNKLFEKIIAVLLIITLAGANLTILGMYGVTYALSDTELSEQTTDTENTNVEFNSYFEGGGHIKTEDIESTTAKLFVNIKVKNAGYLTNAEISFQDVNFKISGEIENESVQSVDKTNNTILLKQLNNGSDVTLEIPISILNENNVALDNFSKETKTEFKGTYIDGSGKEKSVSKEIVNKLLWNGTAEASVQSELTKYIPYAKNGEYGVMIQTKINSSLKDNKLPIKTTKLNVSVPEINGTKPTTVNVIATNMQATNGENSGLDFGTQNYTYDAETGIVNINVSNASDKITWLKNVADEYLVTYIFEGEEIYNYANTNGVDTTSKVSAKIEAYNNVETILELPSEIVTTIKTNTKLGTIADFDIDSTNYVSKGQIYANYDATVKQETSYSVRYTSTINSADLTDEIQFTQSIDKFLNSEEDSEALTTVSGSNYAYNKAIRVNEKVFKKILGEEGKITVYNIDKTEIGTIDKNSTLENEEYVLDISNKNNNEILIITSKPIIEGQLVIDVEKAIKTNIAYTKAQMQTFAKMKVELEGKASTSTVKTSREILLTEPSSVAEVAISRTDLTTVVKNENVEIRATLDISNINNALYKNPTLKIKFPSYISQIDIKGKNIVMANGLAIKGTPQVTTENGSKVINIELEGTQTEYAIDAEYKGTIVVLYTDITVETLTPSNSNKITMEFTNQNEVSTNASGIAEAELNFVAPTGIVAANGISNYAEGKNDIMSISDESITGTIAAYSEKRTATIFGKVVNNYSNSIGNVVILGRIPSKDNKKIDSEETLGSTFDTTLSSNIALTGIDSSKYTVYYSENKEATTDLANTDNAWSTTATTGAKSYLIVTNDYEMEAGKMIEFAYNIEIPADLKHNNNSYEMYKVYYNNISSIGTIAESKTSSIIGITTGQGPELTAELKSTVENVHEGQFIKMKVNVKNTGSITAKNVKVNVPLPEDAIFVDYVTGNGFYNQEETTKVIDVGTLEPGKSKEVAYYIKLDDCMTKIPEIEDSNNVSEEEIEQIENATKFPKEIVNKVKITADELTGAISSNECILSVQDGKISISMTGDVREEQILKENDVIEYTIDVVNISASGDLNNTVVTIPLASGTKYKSAVIKDNWASEEETTDGVYYDESTNTVQVNIGTLSIKKTIILEIEIEEFNGPITIMANAKADGVEEHYSNITEYMSQVIELEVSELTSTPKYIKEGDTVTYSLTIKNTCDATIDYINVVDVLPEELTFVKATYMYAGVEQIVTNLKNGRVEILIDQMTGGESITIKVFAKAGLLPDKNDKEIQNKMSVTAESIEEIQTNTVTNIIEYNSEIRNPGENPTEPTVNRYKITGTAWIDSNKNGKRDSDEETLSGVEVMLLNKKDNQIVKDPDTNESKKQATGSGGKYEFNNLPQGEYIVIFLYDASSYSLTTYREKGVDESLNSDAININVTIDGKRTIAGTTDVITISKDNARDIDIGLYSSEKFDLKLDKYISKITLTTPTIGTKTYTYNNEQIAKIEVLGKNLGQSSIVIEYKIVVTNEGRVPGYAKKIVDYLPKGVGFNTELNKDWYLSENGNVYNASLANEIINPGESKELTLIVTKKITEESLGVLNNNAEIYESYNEQGLKDMDSVEANKAEDEDDISKADIYLSIVTGKIIMYTTITLGVVAILAFGIFEIKKRVLDKKNN